MIRHITLLTLICLTYICVSAQNSSVGMAAKPPGNLYGKIIDGQTGRPIDAATVQILLISTDSSKSKNPENILATALTNKKGEFNIEGLPVVGSLKVQVTAIGYGYYEAPVSFLGAISGILKDLGNIKLEVDKLQLDNI